MNQVIISIVMPVHNTGKYLEESLQSVFQQSFQQFELICVDDASEDELTIDTLNKYQMTHDNMRVIRMDTNVGAGQARNIGFEYAQGKYVMYLDADDIFDEQMLEKLYHKIVKENADICVCGYRCFQEENGEKIFTRKRHPELPDATNTKKETWLLYQFTAPWTQLYKNDFLRNEKISFQTLSSYNDVFFTCMLLKRAKKIVYLTDEYLINYRISTNTQISANRNPMDLVCAIQLISVTLQKERAYDEITQKQFALLLMYSELIAISRCTRTEWNRKAYLMTQTYLSESSLSFDNKLYQAMFLLWKEKPYESRWFERDAWYGEQLRLWIEELKQLLEGKTKVFLWGTGKRGQAFQQLCREENLKLCGVTDIKNIDIGTVTKEGYKIYATENVLQQAELIVASNKNIFEFLKNNWSVGEIVNLEELCSNCIW